MRLMKSIAKLKRMDLTLVITMLTGFLITIQRIECRKGREMVGVAFKLFRDALMECFTLEILSELSAPFNQQKSSTNLLIRRRLQT
jgi:hypothetical protein